MNVKTALNNELLAQDFAGEVNLNRYLTHYKQVASMYAEVENSIAVLSDMGSNRSYIYYGKVGEFLGIALHGECHLIESIWEEEIFSRIHPDDLVKKHTRELRFLHFLKNALEKQRNDYYLEEYLRMCDSVGKFNLSTVVTHHTSDWSVITLDKPVPYIWIKAVRRLDAVEVFYSFDDKTYVMMRNAWLQDNTPVKVGLMGACPDGEGFNVKFEHFKVTHLPDQRRMEWLKKNAE
jgi:hypothetical protein